MTKSFTLDKPKRSEGWAKFQEWNRKWNRILASIFCILCFILLFAIVIVNIIETKEIHMEKSTATNADVYLINEYDETLATTTALIDGDYDAKIKSFSYQKATIGSCTITSCKVYCKNNMLESVNSDILLAIESNSESSCSKIALDLDNYISTNKTLYKNWYTLPYPITAIEIKNSEFEIIEDYAFNSNQFETTTSLKLTFLESLKKLTKNVFTGLGAVKTVYLEMFTSLNEIETGILDPMGAILSTISIHNMPPKLLISNITGNEVERLSFATTASLHNNNFGDRLTANCFNGLKYIMSLYLHNSKITYLPSGVFDCLKNIQLINLRGNLLRTIPSGIFNIVLPLVQLSGNEFDCICDEGILYLQELVKNFPNKVRNEVTCDTPSEHFNKLLETVEITNCQTVRTTSNSETNTPDDHSKNTNSETDTTSLTTITDDADLSTPMQPVNNIYLNCENHTNHNVPEYVLPIMVEGQSAEFKIIKDSNLDIFIEFEVHHKDVSLLWFTENTTTESFLTADLNSNAINYVGSMEYRCAHHVKQRVKIENLRENTVYIFCVMDKDDGKVIPFNCAAFRLICDFLSDSISDNHDDDTWIAKSDKVIAIAIFSASLLLAILSGALVMYCCLKRFPFFVTNNKKQRKASRPWLNNADEIVEYHTPPNYITPTPARRPTKINADRTQPNLCNRRFSETSAGSARSYVSAVTPSPFDIISFRMNNNKQKYRLSSNKPEATYDEARDNNLYLDKFPDVPPPLPPYPNRRSNQSNLSSNQSTNSTASSDPLFSISYRVQRDTDKTCMNSYA